MKREIDHVSLINKIFFFSIIIIFLIVYSRPKENIIKIMNNCWLNILIDSFWKKLKEKFVRSLLFLIFRWFVHFLSSWFVAYSREKPIWNNNIRIDFDFIIDHYLEFSLFIEKFRREKDLTISFLFSSDWQ